MVKQVKNNDLKGKSNYFGCHYFSALYLFRLKYGIILLLPLFFAFNMHEYHLSNTKVVFNEKEQSLQITMRCFIDDIEKTINDLNMVTLELGNDRELKNTNVYIKNYLMDNFIVWVNDKKLTTNYIGKEEMDDIVYFYIEIKQVKSIRSIKIENTILLKNFNDQQNIIRLEVNKKKKTFLLKNNYSSEELIF